jgi:hypothetical protein
MHAGRESGQQLVISVGGLGIMFLKSQALRLVIAGLLRDEVGILGVVGDMVENLLGIGIITAAKRAAPARADRPGAPSYRRDQAGLAGA